jgi:hypothetical protein
MKKSSRGSRKEGGPSGRGERPAAKPPRDEPTAQISVERGEREKKERVLHTRVPAVLESELKRFADSLRVPVSNLIRTILEDAVGVADRATGRVEKELRSAAATLDDERRKLRDRVARREPLDGVFGYQPITLATDGECARCGRELAAGAAAHLGLTDRPGRRVFVCSGCVPNPKGERR